MIVAIARIAFPHEVANTPSDRRPVKVLGGFARAWHAVGMAITKARVRKLALALEDASEVVHVDRPAFRTTRKIFVTLPPDAQAANLMFDVATQEFFCEQAPHAFAPLSGGWGRMGITVCDLKAADEATFLSALKAAHALALPKPKKAKRTAKRS